MHKPRRALPSTQALLAFEAAARLSSFKAAAQELSVTPSAISHRVGQLEAYCGRPVFLRDVRRIRLSAFGHQILPEVKAALGRIGGLQRTSLPGEGLRISVPPLFCAAVLSPKLPSLKRLLPDTRFEFRVAATRRVSRAFSGAVTFGRIAPEGWRQIELLKAHTVVVAGRSGATQDLALSAAGGRWPLIRYAYAPAAWEGRVPEAKHIETVSVTVSSMTEALALAKLDGGLALVIEELVRPELDRGELHIVPGSRRRAPAFSYAYDADHPSSGHLMALGQWLADRCSPV